MNVSTLNKLLFFCIIVIHNFVFSQITIKGKISFESTEKNNLVSIILKQGNRTINYSFSNSDNSYEIETNEYGSFTLTFSSLNFETKSIDIEITTKSILIEKNINLVYKPIELNEVIIETEKQIEIKNDTITFLAKSFLQGNEKVVEDLLKKIPGLNIDQNGTIKVDNQEIEKVMIDGDDIFEKGYKILTKNMPVNPIEKVELYQNYSNNKHLKGIENSDKIALNLTLKQDAKRIWFGNMDLGYGLASQNRYEVKANLMNFGKNNKYYFTTNLNNVGNDATGDIDHLIRPFRQDEPGSIGDNQSANSVLSLGKNTPNLKQKRVNFNNAEMLSLNSIYSLTNNIKIKTLGFLKTDENDFFRNNFQSFTLNETVFENNEDFIGREKQITGFGKIDLIYDISKTKTFEYIIKFNKTNEKNRSNLIFNNDSLNEKLVSNNQLFDQKIVFSNKYKDNKVIILSGRYINEKTPQNYSVNQFIFEDLFNFNANNTKQYSQDKMQFLAFESHILDKKNNGDLLEIKLGNQLRTDNLNTSFQLFDDENLIAEPIGFKNNLKYFSNDTFLLAKYSFEFGNFKLLTQSEFHQLFNKVEQDNFSKNQNPFFIIPKLDLEWIISDKNKVVYSYSLNIKNTEVLDIYSGFIQTGFRSFSKGLEEFNQLNSTSSFLKYTYGNWGDKLFLNTFILYSKNHDFYSSNSTISQNYSLSDKIIIKNREFATISTNIDYCFKDLKANLKINLSGSKTNFKNIVNSSNLREIKNLGAEYGLEIRSSFKGIFNYHAGSKWNYTKVKTTISNSFTNNTTFMDLSFTFNNKLNFELQSERYFFGNLENESNKYYFIDLEARYTVKENKLTIFLSGNNFFNTKTFNNYSISDISISKTEYRLQPRYVLLKMEYRF